MFIGMPILMAIFGLVFFKFTSWNLADEVIDEADALLFCKGSKRQKVYLKDILNIHLIGRPEQLCLQVRSEGEIGKRLTFMPPPNFNPLVENPVVKDLKARIELAEKA